MMKWYALGLLLVMGSASLQCFAGLEEGNNAYYREDYETALKEFMPLAEQGNAKAQSKLGKMYYNGQGVKKDYANALDWYKKSALGGDSNAQVEISFMHSEGHYNSLLEDFLPLAEQGNMQAQFIIGDFFFNTNQDKAIIWFRKSAEQGQPEAQFRLGMMTEKGQGTLKSNEDAADWYLKSATQSNMPNFGSVALGKLLNQMLIQNKQQEGRWFLTIGGQKSLAMEYSSKNKTESALWYLKAAEQGDLESQKAIGGMYLNGRGVIQDYRQAAHWFLRAAGQGDAHSQLIMAEMYENGIGTTKNIVLAHMMSNLASVKGNTEATNKRKELTLLLMPTQLAEAQELASKWKVGTPLPTTTKTQPNSSKKGK